MLLRFVPAFMDTKDVQTIAMTARKLPSCEESTIHTQSLGHHLGEAFVVLRGPVEFLLNGGFVVPVSM